MTPNYIASYSIHNREFCVKLRDPDSINKVESNQGDSQCQSKACAHTCGHTHTHKQTCAQNKITGRKKLWKLKNWDATWDQMNISLGAFYKCTSTWINNSVRVLHYNSRKHQVYRKMKTALNTSIFWIDEVWKRNLGSTNLEKIVISL